MKKLKSNTIPQVASERFNVAARIDSMRFNVPEQRNTRGGDAEGSVLIGGHFVLLENMLFRVCL